MLVKPQSATPRCTAIVDLLSQVQRPYLFRVTVTGEPPHAYRRMYDVCAPGDLESASDAAAMKGLELFTKEFTTAAPIRKMESLAPRAVRQ